MGLAPRWEVLVLLERRLSEAARLRLLLSLRAAQIMPKT